MAEPIRSRGPLELPEDVGRLRRTLSFRDLIVYGLLFIAPMAPVGVFGALDVKSQGAVPLVYLVATVAMAFTAYSYARMLRAVPHAGSVYAYARSGLGPSAGFLAGWMMMLDYVLIPAVAYLFSGIAMAQLVPQVDQWIWTALAVVLTTALNLSGVRRAALVGFLVLALELVALVVFVAAAVVVLVQDGPQRGWLSPFSGDVGFSADAVLSAVSVAVLSYLGFDAIANFAEESTTGRSSDDGRSSVSRALVWCLVTTGVLFIVQTYLAAVLSPTDSQHLANEGAAFYDAVDSSVGSWLETLIAASKALGAAFAALAGQAAAGRLLFAMARDRRLPHRLASVSRRTGVPWVTILVSAVVTMAAAVWAARAAEGLDRLVSIVDIGALFGFGMLHLSVIGYYGVSRELGAAGLVRDWLLPLVGLGIIVTVIVTANREAHWVGLAWFVLALVVLLVLRARGRLDDGADGGSATGGFGHNGSWPGRG